MRNADGVVVIGTELDTKQLEKDLEREKKNLEKYDQQIEKLTKKKAKVEVEIEIKGKEFERKIAEIEKRRDIQIATNVSGSIRRRRAKDEQIREEAQLRINQLQAQYEQFLEESDQKIIDIDENIQNVQQDQEISHTNILNISNALEEVKQQEEQITFSKIKQSLHDISNSMEKTVKKVGRWALGIFGIRSAYMMVRSAMNIISQNDEKLANDITYIKNVLAYALEPVVRTIVAWAKQLLYYVGYIIKGLTGYDIFANANKNLKNATGNAKKLNKELSKTTASFDEMNILQKQDDSGGGDNGLAGSKMELGDTPEWMKDLLPTITGIVAGVMALLKGMKLIKALGLGITIAGIVKLIQDIIDYLKDPSWEKFGDILIDIGIILAGLAIMFASWPLALAAAIVLMLGLIAHFWDDIKEWLSNLKKNIIKLGDDVKNWLHDHLGILGDLIGVGIDIFVGTISGAIDFILDLFDGLFGGLKDIADGIISLFRDGVGEGLKKIFKGVANIIITALNAVVDGLNIIFAPIRAIIMVAGKVLGKDWTMDDVKIPKIPKLARGGIVHNPGPGVLMGNYIAGEGSSPEAVLPLDDETMDRLGESIARHMTINADIKNYMNARLISRELHKIDSESNFAYNR